VFPLLTNFRTIFPTFFQLGMNVMPR